MKKRKNLLKTLALCSVIGLGVGYAVVSNQTLTYTETIPVGERTINVVINDPNATNNGTTLTIQKTTTIEENPSLLNSTWVYVPLKNNETDLDASVTASIHVYGDETEIPVSFDYNYGICLDGLYEEWTSVLPAGDEGEYGIEFGVDSSVVEQYTTIKIVVTITATPVIN